MVWLIIRRHRRRTDDVLSGIDETLAAKAGRRFPIQQLRDATSNFEKKRKLGAGASGAVYRGLLKSPHREVAVKRIWHEDTQQRRKEYMAEVEVISQLRHRHLVQLLGWCHEKGEFLLVYELLPNLSLDRHLFAVDKLLPWPRRYNIVLQVASALLYLHEDWLECIVHRDIKPSNILLDDAFNAKVGDFGVARLAKHGSGLPSTTLCGTIGYLAPECFQTGKASRGSDVYAFGIVALEVATGRRSIEPSARESEVRLVEWVWSLFETGDVVLAADQMLENAFDAAQMERLLVVGLWCAHPDVLCRPSIRKALAALNFEDHVKIDLPLKMPVAMFASPPSLDPSCCGTFSSGGATTRRSDASLPRFGSF